MRKELYLKNAVADIIKERRKSYRVMMVIAAVLLVMCVVIIRGCGDKYEKSRYAGKWKCVSAQMHGVRISADRVVADFCMVLGTDGKATAVITESKTEGEWEETKNGFVIKSGDKELKFRKRDDDIVYSDSDVEITFRKEK